jgi:microcystin-dependent protein
MGWQVNLLPVLRTRYFDADGAPLAGGKLYTYQSGTTTPQATYTDSAGGTPNANPVVLDANGEAAVWADPSLSYKFVLKNSSDVTQWTVDNVVGLLTDEAVATASIQDSAVTAAKLATGAVTAAKLAYSAVNGQTNESGIVAADEILFGDSSAAALRKATLEAVMAVIMPTGTVLPYAGSSAPTGFLLCYGQAVSRTTYATLFGILSTTYGVGDGSTTFNLPDLRGRAVAGKDDMGGAAASRLTNDANGFGTSAAVLGAVGGSQSHTLTTAQLASHDHTMHAQGPTSGGYLSNGSSEYSAGGGETFGRSASPDTDMRTSVDGSGTAHNNVQPTIIFNYIIKT